MKNHKKSLEWRNLYVILADRCRQKRTHDFLGGAFWKLSVACQLGMDAAHRDSEAQADTPHHSKVTGCFWGRFYPCRVRKFE
mgnify:CR=1 FL=1